MQSILFAALAVLISAGAAFSSDWPQFRGPNASGRAVNESPLPSELGPSANLLWKTPLPAGHSSPVVVGDRIYLTAARHKQLMIFALERGTGKVLWEKEIPTPALEKIHKIGSHAQSTQAADQERVVSFFGSAGLFCHDRSGKLLWQIPMGPFRNDFGAASSPILVGDWVILCQDHDQKSFLTAIDKRTGKEVWKTDRSDFLRGFCTPVMWNKQIVVAGTLRVAGYDLQTGKEMWTVHGISRTVCATPVVGEDGRLYLSGWSQGGDPGAPIDVEPWGVAIKNLDKNANGKLERAELLKVHPYGERFSQVDTDGSDFINQAEYARFRDLFEKGKNVVLALTPGGKGDITATHVAWSNSKQVPFCASPLFYQGHVYTIKDGGLFACLDAKDGKATKFERLQDSGTYYSSPVAGDGKVYVISSRGLLSVLRAGRDWEVLSTTDFAEDAYATPAIVDGRIYLRTSGHLYCFGMMGKR